MADQAHCGNCYYFQYGDDSDKGYCLRHAPVVIGGMMGPHSTVWPSVDRHDWCGEHSTADRPTPDKTAG